MYNLHTIIYMYIHKYTNDLNVYMYILTEFKWMLSRFNMNGSEFLKRAYSYNRRQGNHPTYIHGIHSSVLYHLNWLV